jgi:hypothetical protein
MTVEHRDWRLLSRKQVHQDVAAGSQAILLYHKAANEMLTRWAGRRLPSMRGAVSNTVDCLTHEDYLLRLSAVFLLHDHWPKTEFTASLLAGVPFTDPNAIVRGVALDSLRWVYGWVYDPEGTLAALFPNSSEEWQRILHGERDHASIVKNRRARWVDLIGPLAEEMLTDLCLIEQSLKHPNPQVRLVAVSILTDMHPSEYAVSVALEMIQSPAEEAKLRKVAVHVLARYQEVTNSTSLNTLFASLVNNETLPTEVRGSAYFRLLQIRGIRIPEETLMRLALNQFRFPEDVDWKLVASFSEDPERAQRGKP